MQLTIRNFLKTSLFHCLEKLCVWGCGGIGFLVWLGDGYVRRYVRGSFGVCYVEYEVLCHVTTPCLTLFSSFLFFKML